MGDALKILRKSMEIHAYENFVICFYSKAFQILRYAFSRTPTDVATPFNKSTRYKSNSQLHVQS